MANVYFHYSHNRGVLIDRSGANVEDLIEAREHAHCIIKSLVMTSNSEDWRGWVLHVTDNNGEEILNHPFAAILGKSH